MILVWILGDQLLENHPALALAEEQSERENIRVVLIESNWRSEKLPYHKHKLILLFSAMRHYAEMLQERGYTADYIRAENFTDGLQKAIEAHKPEQIITMAAADYTGRQFQEEKLSEITELPVEVIPNRQFLLSEHNPYPDYNPDKRYVMEYFYRDMRKHFDVLMDGDVPVGGQWNFDKQNRKPLPQNIDLPDMPEFAPDAITKQVIEDIQESAGVGSIDGFNYAVTHAGAERALVDFVSNRLENFGTYEDAMTKRDGHLFHAILSPYLNIGLLTPMQVIDAVERAYYEKDAPLNSVEGFVRQVMGWREYMYWQYWQLMPDLAEQNHWNAQRPVPQMFWDGKTDMNCIKHIVTRLLGTGYSHHIERLMVISNFYLLAGIQPQAVLDWFKAFYIDAYDWVMQPNVIGMGLNADGGKIATKPYVASANYINKMGDYCQDCALKHTKRTGDGACPFNYLYWNFLIENEESLRANPRTGRNVLNLRHLDDTERQAVQQQAQEFLDNLEFYDA